MVIAFLLLCGLVVALLLATGWGLTVSFTKEACCTGCRYPTGGLPGDRCPECGGHLAGRGTLAAGARVIVLPPWPIAAASRTIVVAGLAAIPFFGLAWERPWCYSFARASVPVAAGQNLVIRGWGSATGLPPFPEATPIPRWHTAATLIGPARTVSLRVLNYRLHAVYDGPAGRVRTVDGVEEGDIAAWMAAAGCDPPPTADEVAGVLIVLRDLAKGFGPRLPAPALGKATFDENQWELPNPAVTTLVLGPAIAVWVWQMVSLLRTGRSPRFRGRALKSP